MYIHVTRYTWELCRGLTLRYVDLLGLVEVGLWQERRPGALSLKKVIIVGDSDRDNLGPHVKNISLW